eukprot:1147821-Pelagomonas_calceolata.AAC.6
MPPWAQHPAGPLRAPLLPGPEGTGAAAGAAAGWPAQPQRPGGGGGRACRRSEKEGEQPASVCSWVSRGSVWRLLCGNKERRTEEQTRGHKNHEAPGLQARTLASAVLTVERRRLVKRQETGQRKTYMVRQVESSEKRSRGRTAERFSRSSESASTDHVISRPWMNNLMKRIAKQPGTTQ